MYDNSAESVQLMRALKNKHLSYITEVESTVAKIAKNTHSSAGKERRSYYGTVNKVLGLTVPQQRQLLKIGYSFSKLPIHDQLIIWDSIWRHSKYHESKAQALFWLSNIQDTKILIGFWSTINKWTEHVDSWDASDNLSSVYVRILEDADHVIYPTLQKWNKSTNSWERRQSIVSLLYYSSARRKVLSHKKILSLIEKLIKDRDKFVQKGVGWALRECYSIYPVATEKFIRQHATAISAIAFTAAAEKWPKSLLAEIKNMRSAHRQALTD